MTGPPVVLAIAGTDSGGAAGLAADLSTIGHLGAHAACAVTSVTAQDTTGVHAVHPVPTDVVAAQLDAVLDDLPVAAAKTGMLGSAEVVRIVAERLTGDAARHAVPLVVDPVLVATSGAVLGDRGVVRAYVDHLLPMAAVATPNLAEARALTGRDGTPRDLAMRLADLGCAVVLTGGPEWRPGEPARTCTDWLCLPGGRAQRLEHPGVPTTNDHGTGCTFSSALAALLAHTDRQKVAASGAAPRGPIPADALVPVGLRAAAYVTTQLTASSTWTLGRGRGPVAHTVSTGSITERTRPTTEEPQEAPG